MKILNIFIKNFPPLKYIGLKNINIISCLCLGFMCIYYLIIDRSEFALTIFPFTVLLDLLGATIFITESQDTSLSKHLGSISNSFNFCFIPVFLYLITINNMSLIMLLSLVIYVLSGFWRLAYYSVHSNVVKKENNMYFVGMTTPESAIYIYFYLIVYKYLIPFNNSILVILLLGHSLSMVSSINIKKFSLRTGLVMILSFFSIFIIWMK